MFSGVSGQLLGERSVGVGRLKVGVAAEVLAIDENVGHGPLASLLIQGVLDGVSVLFLVELLYHELNALALEQLLGSGAVWAPALAVHHDLVGLDLRIDYIH